MKNFLNYKTILAIFFVAVVLFSCKKQEVEVGLTEDQKVEQRILDFKKNVENPSNLKSDETISVDDAVWLVEAALNYSYCITVEPEAYENCEIIIDSVEFDFLVNENLISLNNTVNIYNDFENYFIQYSNNLDFTFKKYNIADIDVKENKIVCKFILFVKNLTKAQIGPQSALNNDWKTGAGGCDGGTCDGTIEEGSVQTVLNACLNDKSNIVKPDYYLTDIKSGLSSSYHSDPFNVHHMLLDTIVSEYSPCITSEEMYKLFNNARTIVNTIYTPPTGWRKAYCDYFIYRSDSYYYPNIYYTTDFNLYIGLAHSVRTIE